MLEVGVHCLPPGLACRHVCLEVGHHGVVQLEKRGVAGAGNQTVGSNLLQQSDRVVAGGLPQAPVQELEQAAGIHMPAPPQVIGQFTQPFNAFW